MPHDQRFKELLQAFLREFMEMFFPQVAARLDFSRVTFLDKEHFTDLPEGSRREMDVVAEIYTLDGEPELILLHTEIQAKRERDFSERMFEYYTLLRRRYRIPVFPVVLYLAAGAGGVTSETYTEALFGEEILRFRYSAVGLPDLDAKDYRDVNSPMVALTALMQSSDMGKARHKRWNLQKAVESGVDEARLFLLLSLIEAYLPLNEGEEVEFRQLLAEPEAEEVREMISVYEERGLEKGIEQGIEQGIARGKRETLLKLLRHKFGDLPESVVATVETMASTSELDTLLERVLDANTLDEMGLT